MSISLIAGSALFAYYFKSFNNFNNSNNEIKKNNKGIYNISTKKKLYSNINNHFSINDVNNNLGKFADKYFSEIKFPRKNTITKIYNKINKNNNSKNFKEITNFKDILKNNHKLYYLFDNYNDKNNFTISEIIKYKDKLQKISKYLNSNALRKLKKEHITNPNFIKYVKEWKNDSDLLMNLKDPYLYAKKMKKHIDNLKKYCIKCHGKQGYERFRDILNYIPKEVFINDPNLVLTFAFTKYGHHVFQFRNLPKKLQNNKDIKYLISKYDNNIIQVIRDADEKGYSIKKLEKILDKNKKYFNLEKGNYNIDTLENNLKNMDQDYKKENPIAITLISKKDHNSGFLGLFNLEYNSRKFDKISKYYKNFVFEIGSDKDLFDYIDRVHKKHGKISRLLLYAHGFPGMSVMGDNIKFGEDEQHRELTKKDIPDMNKRKNYFTNEALICINSCYAGFKGKKYDNIVNICSKGFKIKSTGQINKNPLNYDITSEGKILGFKGDFYTREP